MSKKNRKFEAGPFKKGIVLAFLLVLGGGAIIIYNAVAPAFSGVPASDVAASSEQSNRAKNGAGFGMSEGNGYLSSSTHETEKIRAAAREMDRQLLAKLNRKRESRDNDSDLSGQFDSQDHAERVSEDYDQVKKAKNLSKSMKADFKKHYQNITLDTAN